MPSFDPSSTIIISSNLEYCIIISTIRSVESWEHFMNAMKVSTVFDFYNISNWVHKQTIRSSTPIRFYCEDRNRVRSFAYVLKGNKLPAEITPNIYIDSNLEEDLS